MMKDIEKMNSQELKVSFPKLLADTPAEKRAEVTAEFTALLAEVIATEQSESFLNKALLSMNDDRAKKDLGLRNLTNEEKTFFKGLMNTIKNPKDALTTKQTDVFPLTTINRITEDLKLQSELLSVINIHPAGVLKILVGDYSGNGGWGKITAAITDELTADIKGYDTTVKRGSAFIALAKALVDLGEAYVESFIRSVLTEALLYVLEVGISTGDGNDAPIGMDRDLSKKTNDVYAEKEKIKVKDFLPITYGSLVAKLTKNGKRAILNVVLLVNPMDYLEKVMPAMTMRTPTGEYVSTLPFPTKLVQLAGLPRGKAIMGIGKNYDLGISKITMEVYGELRALNDEYLYLGKVYGDGTPKDNYSFIVLDISELDAHVNKVLIVNDEDKPVLTKTVGEAVAAFMAQNETPVYDDPKFAKAVEVAVESALSKQSTLNPTNNVSDVQNPAPAPTSQKNK